MKKVYLVLHSHFYQPPREDPWSMEIAPQQSASPYSNWNERITAECYIPNSKAKVLNSSNKLINILNNYKYYNFNFGPTLLDWIKDKEKLLYEIIIDGDKRSKKLNNNYGNAIAQVYNHIIMPLADYEDKKTQIIWGIEDFKFHFNRSPASIWLAETAIDYNTVDVLVEFPEIKYVILSPFQAQSVRKIGTTEWEDVSKGDIDTTRAYRLYSKKYPDKYINVFFYDGDLSHKISFENLLTDAKLLFEEIKARVNNNKSEAQIISVATDGETYGHHHKFGEKAISYLISELLPDSNIEITNFENFLSKYPAEYEVEIIGGEGSAWSCSHGVGRWYRDCGCKIDAGRNWNQKWRTPLRNSLNYLRDELRKIYLKKTEKYFNDSMAARNEYIKLLLDKSETAREKFFRQTLKIKVSEKEKNMLIKLLEIQKYAMYIFTSCAWFFDDITDIATIQILKYAAWAIFLNKEFEESDIEKKFLEELEKAESNIPKYKNGRWMYENIIKPEILTFKKIVNYIVFSMALNNFKPDIPEIYEYTIIENKLLQDADEKILKINIRIKNLVTNDIGEYEVISIQKKALDLTNIIVNKDNSEKIKILSETSPELLVENPKLRDNIFSIQDMGRNEAKKIIELFINSESRSITEKYFSFFDRYNNYIHFLADKDIGLDVRFKVLISEYFTYYINKFSMSAYKINDIINNTKLVNILRYSKKYKIEINTKPVKEIIIKEIDSIKFKILKHNYIEYIETLYNILELSNKAGFNDIKDYLQEEVFYILRKSVIPRINNLIGRLKFNDTDSHIKTDKYTINEYKSLLLFVNLADRLGIEVGEYKKILEGR